MSVSLWSRRWRFDNLHGLITGGVATLPGPYLFGEFLDAAGQRCEAGRFGDEELPGDHRSARSRFLRGDKRSEKDYWDAFQIRVELHLRGQVATIAPLAETISSALRTLRATRMIAALPRRASAKSQSFSNAKSGATNRCAHCFGCCLFTLRQIERAVLGDGLFHNLSRPESSPRLAPYF